MLSLSTTVVITCYAEGELVWEAVQSAWRQSIPPTEVIVVYDASGDAATIQVCERIVTQNLGTVIWQGQNGGTAAARNQGFAAAKGEILIPLDGDDLLPEEAISHITQTFAAHPEAGFIYGAYRKLCTSNNTATKEEIVTIADIGDISLGAMLRAKPFSLSSQWRLIGTTPLRRSLWQKIGGYDTEFGIDDLHDVEFWIRAIATGAQGYAVASNPALIYTWRKYLGSNSRRVSPLAWARVAAKHYDIYVNLGIEYRALELLLLGSKWESDQAKINDYGKRLWQQFWWQFHQGHWQLTSLVVLILPVGLLRWLGEKLQKRR
jgi:glycosyltransferase involved in cell wall biosynthesis